MHTDNYTHEDSFIKLGPIKYIESEYGKEKIRHYRWSEDKDDHNSVYLDEERLIEIGIATDIKDDILTWLSEIPKEQNLDEKVPGHLILLIYDIIDIMKIVKMGEIETVLNILGFQITEKDIRKYLFILTKLDLVIEEPFAGATYYATIISKPFIKYKYTKEASIKDRMRWQIFFREALRKDSKRNRAYAEFEKKHLR